jgi:uncharacterized RDD family membrane protein YckC
MAAATAVAGSTGEKVGFWRRFVALFIDFIVLAIVNQIVANGMYGGDSVAAGGLTFIIDIAYFVGLWTYWNGQTLGKKAMGIKVVRTDGAPVNLTTAIIRYVGYIVSTIVIFLGYIWVAFDPNKQGWHDKIASTYVVKA